MNALTGSKKTIILFKGSMDGDKGQKLNEALNDDASQLPLARFIRAAQGLVQICQIEA